MSAATILLPNFADHKFGLILSNLHELGCLLFTNREIHLVHSLIP